MHAALEYSKIIRMLIEHAEKDTKFCPEWLEDHLSYIAAMAIKELQEKVERLEVSSIAKAAP